MKLSSQKDLLLVTTSSVAVLIISWLRLLSGDLLTFIQYVSILLLPGYAIMTAIWPTDEKIGWSMRAGVGFVMGLFFILFLPLIFRPLEIGSPSGNLTSILLSLAVILSIIAMVRRKEPSEEEIPENGVQLTLEESIQRAAEMRQRVVDENGYGNGFQEEYVEDEYPEEYDHYDNSEYEEVSDESKDNNDEFSYKKEEDHEPSDEEEIGKEESDEYEDLKEEKPLQYERMRERGYLDEEPPADEKSDEKKSESAPLLVEEPVKTEPSTTEYEEMIYRPFWMEEETEKKSGFKSFKNWDLVILLLLSGISSLLLYFNPMNDTISNTILFIILLFIPGYAGLTLIFPDRSSVSSNKTILFSVIIAIILFIIAFLAWTNALLPDVPSYLIGIIFIATVILVVGIFLRKQRMDEVPDEEPVEEVSTEPVPSEEEILKEPVKEESLDADEKPVLVSDENPEEEPSSAGKTVGIVDDKKVDKEPPTYKPNNYYTDIILIVVLTLLTAVFVLIPPLNKTLIRTILGLVLVLFIPGYSLIIALFPKWGDLDGIERTAFSFGLSIAVAVLMGLALDYTPWGFRQDPVLISITVFTMAMCFIAFVRRKQLPEKERFFVPFGGFVKNIRGPFKIESRTDKILTIFLIISILVAISTTTFLLVNPKQNEKFTEFYILGPNGTASDYPSNLTTGQQGSVIIGVVNHEYATKNYQLVVTLGNQTIKNETITLNSSQKMEIPFNFTAGSAGENKMEFSLYKLPDQDTVYRSLHLWLNVTG